MSARRARSFLRDCALAWTEASSLPAPYAELPDAQLLAHLEVASLLVSELVTNVVLHVRSSCTLAVSLQPEPLSLLVGVEDEALALPLRRGYSTTSGTGRGIALVEDLSSAWGVEPCEGGKRVWFSLHLEDTHEAFTEFDFDAVQAL